MTFGRRIVVRASLTHLRRQFVDVPPGQIRAGGMLPHRSRNAIGPTGPRTRFHKLRGGLLPACCTYAVDRARRKEYRHRSPAGLVRNPRQLKGECMRLKGLGVAGVLAACLVMLVTLAAPPKAEASIHEIIAALCRATGEEVVPYGQNKIDQSASFLRALQATGFLTSIDTSDPSKVVLNFDPTVPNSKIPVGGFRRDHSGRSGARRRPGAESARDSRSELPGSRQLRQPQVAGAA